LYRITLETALHFAIVAQPLPPSGETRHIPNYSARVLQYKIT